MIPRRIILLSPILVAASTFAQSPQDTFEGVKRIVAIGDVHGDLQALTTMLRTAELINAKNAWIGGEAHLVLTGDFVDRGPDSAKVLDLLIALEPQAQKAGGRVHALIGNHETMDVYGDLTYVPKEEFKNYQQVNSQELRESQMNVALENLKQNRSAPADERAWQKQYEADHPLGWVEHRMAFLPTGKYGKWLRQKNTIIKINDAIFLHGGISLKYAKTSIREINDEVRAELADFSKIATGIIGASEDGPLWYRGLAQNPETDAGMQALVDQVLKTHAVSHIVIGHTPMAAVMPRFGGKVITVDVGVSKAMYSGPPAFLLIQDSKYYAVHRGHQIDLPVNGGNVLSYLREAARADPPDSLLQKQLATKK